MPPERNLVGGGQCRRKRRPLKDVGNAPFALVQPGICDRCGDARDEFFEQADVSIGEGCHVGAASHDQRSSQRAVGKGGSPDRGAHIELGERRAELDAERVPSAPGRCMSTIEIARPCSNAAAVSAFVVGSKCTADPRRWLRATSVSGCRYGTPRS